MNPIMTEPDLSSSAINPMRMARKSEKPVTGKLMRAIPASCTAKVSNRNAEIKAMRGRLTYLPFLLTVGEGAGTTVVESGFGVT